MRFGSLTKNSARPYKLSYSYELVAKFMHFEGQLSSDQSMKLIFKNSYTCVQSACFRRYHSILLDLIVILGFGLCCQVSAQEVSYEEWSGLVFDMESGAPSTLPESDYLGNGVANIVAYASGFDPKLSSDNFLPKTHSVVVGETQMIVCDFYLSDFATEVEVTFETSTDLENWSVPDDASTVVPGSLLPDASIHRHVFPEPKMNGFVRLTYSMDTLTEVLIPSVVGLSLQEAFEALQLQRLIIGAISTDQIVNELPGTVRFQGNSAGSLVEAGSSLDLLIAIPLDPNQFIDVFGDRIEENEETALAYYAAVDPRGDKLTLAQWMRVNGVAAADGGVNGAGQTGAVRAETVYFNDGDLGFGRHMYMHVGVDIYGNPSLIYWVTNHETVDDAWQNAGSPLATVAMEYSSTPDGTRAPYVKFYTFGPDGERITHIDLDGRGEKFQPGMCTSCHGGKPNDLVSGVYPDSGDIGTRFLPFDLDTFRFSNINNSYSRANQESEFKVLNEWILNHHLNYTAPVPEVEITEHIYSGGDTVFFNGDNMGDQTLSMTLAGLGGLIQNIEFLIPIPEQGAAPNFFSNPAGNFFLDLVSPSGTSVRLLSANDLNTFEDEASFDGVRLLDGANRGPQDMYDDYPTVTGSFRPSEALSKIRGEDPNGLWMLRFEIEPSGVDMDVELKSWGLRIHTAATSPFNPESFQELPTQGEHFYEGDNITIGADATNVTGSGSIEVSGVVGPIEDLDLRFPAFDGVFAYIASIQSSFTAEDLANTQLILESPAGTRVTLTDPETTPAVAPGEDAVFGEIRFDDAAPSTLGDLSNPFEGTIRPHDSLSAFNGEDPNGVWRLELMPKSTSAPIDYAILRRWSLIFNSDRDPKLAPVEVIQRWYGGDELPGGTHTENEVPVGWREPFAPAGSEQFYLEVLKPSCRICHVNQQNNSITFRNFDEFLSNADRIHHLVYEEGSMPAAKRTFDNFWKSFDPDQYRALLDFLNQQGEVRHERLLSDPLIDADWYVGTRHIAVDPTGRGGIHALINDENQNLLMLSSLDNGLTWRNTPATGLPMSDVHDFVASSETDRTDGLLYMMGGDGIRPDLYAYGRSTSFSWTPKSGTGLPNITNPFELSESLDGSIHDSETLYLNLSGAASSTATLGLYRSINGGDLWTRIHNRPTLDSQEDPLESNLIYAACEGVGEKIEVWMIDTATGNQATKIGDFDAPSLFNSQIAVSRNGDRLSIYLLNANRLFRTDDLGATWVPLNENFPEFDSMFNRSLKNLVTLPSDPGRVYVSTFSSYGILGSHDWGDSWRRVLNADFRPEPGDKVVVAYSLVGHPDKPELFYISLDWDSDGGYGFYRAHVPSDELTGPGRPIAVASAVGKAVVSEDISLDGTRSLYSNGYTWSVLDAPPGATEGVDYQMNNGSIQIATFNATRAGTYTLQLLTQSNALQSEPNVFAVRYEEQAQQSNVSFKTEVVPAMVICKICHEGGAAAPGGFDLTSNNTAVLHSEITADISGKTGFEGDMRVDLLSPASSLILTQPSGQTSHGAGVIEGFEVGNPNYQLLLKWISEGALNN